MRTERACNPSSTLSHHFGVAISQFPFTIVPPVASLLIVDDDVALLSALSRYLANSGFHVASSSAFEDAKQQISSLRPDIVITDVRLGAFNGLQLAILARDVRPDGQVVVFSGFDDPVLKEEARRIGAAYLVKPVSGQQLVNQLSAAGPA
jgi:DNA-binding response OmpR family regulator